MRLLSHIRPAMVLRMMNYGGGGRSDGMVRMMIVPPAPAQMVLAHRHCSSSSHRRYISRDENNESDMTSTRSYTIHSSFVDLVDRYDAFILDQFGVLHNGVAALDGAVELCEYLYRQGKKLIILSNTSAPSDKTLLKLIKLGFDPSLFCGAVTSGEEASRYIRATYGSSSSTNNGSSDNNNNNSPTKVLMLTWDVSVGNNPRLTATPEAFLEQCGNVQIATSIEQADFLLLHGSEVWYRGGAGNDDDDDDRKEQLQQESLGNFIETGDFTAVVDPLLQQCVTRGLKAVCANPDLIVQTPTGGTAFMPGQLARRYQELGGDCTIFGKPAVEHFEACLKQLNVNNNGDTATTTTAHIPKSRVAHVGDSLHHDILGASRAEIPNIFVTSGIHRHELEMDFGVMPKMDFLDRLFRDEGDIVPTHVVSAFRL